MPAVKETEPILTIRRTDVHTILIWRPDQGGGSGVSFYPPEIAVHSKFIGSASAITRAIDHSALGFRLRRKFKEGGRCWLCCCCSCCWGCCRWWLVVVVVVVVCDWTHRWPPCSPNRVPWCRPRGESETANWPSVRGAFLCVARRRSGSNGGGPRGPREEGPTFRTLRHVGSNLIFFPNTNRKIGRKWRQILHGFRG